MNNIIISKTPMRISFFGGGTDFENYYKNNEYGLAISCAIDKYIYVTVKKHSNIFDEKYRLNYSKTEEVSSLNKIQNAIIRESVKYSKIRDPLYISTIADLPGSSGLGSSSSFCVGLLKALYKYRKIKLSKKQLAYLSCLIEINTLNKPMGKQDQQPAVYGGLNYYKFNKDETINITKVPNQNNFKNIIFNNLIFFWSRISRSSEKVLIEQKKNIMVNKDYLDKIKNNTEYVYNLIKKNNYNIEEFGKRLDYSWQLKKNLSSNVSNDFIDEAYELAINSGGIGGKILGAGSGGFLMILAKKENHYKIKRNMKKLNMKDVSFKIADSGSNTII